MARRRRKGTRVNRCGTPNVSSVLCDAKQVIEIGLIIRGVNIERYGADAYPDWHVAFVRFSWIIIARHRGLDKSLSFDAFVAVAGGQSILIAIDVRWSPCEVVRPNLKGWRQARLASPWEQISSEAVPD
jgi:hypothetical protein